MADAESNRPKMFSRLRTSNMHQVLYILIFSCLGATASSVMTSSSRPKTEYACENQVPEIHCTLDETIKVLGAQYGRQMQEYALCQEEDKIIKECGVSEVTHILQPMCDGRQRCSIAVNNAQLGDICPGVYKYFILVFKCVLKPTTSPPPWLSTTKNTTASLNKTTARNTASEKGTTSNGPKTMDPNIKVYDMFSPNGNGGATLSRSQEISFKTGLCVVLAVLWNAFSMRVT